MGGGSVPAKARIGQVGMHCSLSEDCTSQDFARTSARTWQFFWLSKLGGERSFNNEVGASMMLLVLLAEVKCCRLN